MIKRPGWIGVDLDGTLAYYDVNSWKKGLYVGLFIPAMVDRMKLGMQRGFTFKVFTARASDADDLAKIKPLVDERCIAAFGETLEITCTKDYGMIECWDDKCVTVEKNTGRFLVLSPYGFC